MASEQRWPITVTFALYFDHQPDSADMANIGYVSRQAASLFETVSDDVAHTTNSFHGPTQRLRGAPR